MSIQPAVQGTFSFFPNLPVIVETTAAQLTSDAGLLPIREFDERIGLTQAFASVLDDARVLSHHCPRSETAEGVLDAAQIPSAVVDDRDHVRGFPSC